MPNIQPPWPPDSSLDPLPFDQRGACWPRGPCNYHDRIQLRYDAIAYWPGGPPALGWAQWVTGQAFLPLVNSFNCTWIQLDGAPRTSSVAVDFIYIQRSNDWPSGWQIEILSVLNTFPGNGFYVRSEFPTLFCTAPFEFFPIETYGDDPPQSIILTPRRWYEACSYPWYGS